MQEKNEVFIGKQLMIRSTQDDVCQTSSHITLKVPLDEIASRFLAGLRFRPRCLRHRAEAQVPEHDCFLERRCDDILDTLPAQQPQVGRVDGDRDRGSRNTEPTNLRTAAAHAACGQLAGLVFAIVGTSASRDGLVVGVRLALNLAIRCSWPAFTSDRLTDLRMPAMDS